MKKRIRFWQSMNFKIAAAFVVLLLVSLGSIGYYFITTLGQSNIDNFKENINMRVEQLATTIADEFENHLSTDEANSNIQRRINSFDMTQALAVIVVDEHGIVRAQRGEIDENLIGHPSGIQALDDLSLKRESDQLEGLQIYTNVQPILLSDNKVVGAIYVRSVTESEYQQLRNVSTIFYSILLIAGVMALLVALIISRSITRPIEDIREQALRITGGDFSSKLAIHGQNEISQLALTVNQLSDRIESTQENMESERNRLNSVLAHMTDGVIATDRRGKIIIINEMALSQLNLESGEVLGKSILDILKISETYSLRRIIEENPTILVEVENDLDDEPTALHVDFSMIRRESGFISGLVAVFHDVTESSKTERERQQFVSSVSHELRTPLTSMRSYLEALVDGAWQDEEIAPNFLKVTLSETDRMIRMINDLLNLSRMDAGVVTLKKEFVNLNDLVNFVLDRFDMIAKEEKTDNQNPCRFVRAFTKRDLWVEIDTDKITQVLDNLLNNALKYSPDGGKITVKLMETHNNIILSISDEGLGIPRKDLGKIFDRFYRVDKARARAQGGTGLGLAIAKDIIKAHNGQIWAESQENRGSTFFIALPYEPYEDEEWD